MSSFMWTLDQSKALTLENGNYIVSASAGSGKTAVLTERIYRLLENGVSLSSLLILTFTNLAAAQMRDKIRAKLLQSNNPNAKINLASLDASNIQTYDAFALSLVQKYHYRLGINSDVQILDGTLLNLLIQKTTIDVLHEHYDRHDPLLLEMVGIYCQKNDDNLKEIIAKIVNTANKESDIESFYKDFDKRYLSDEAYNEFFNEFNQQILDQIKEINHRIKELENTEYADHLLEKYRHLLNATNYDEVVKNIDGDKEVASKKLMNATEEDKSLNAYIKSLINGLKSKYFFANSKEELLSNAKNINPYIIKFVELAHEVHLRMNEYKKKELSFDFSDIFKLASSLLEMDDVRNEIKTKYQYIMIDEYQDTSDLQEEFINKIADHNCYVVGDVKQSIYKFRNANSAIFLKLFNEYGRGNGGKRLELSDNFRSREEVVRDVNLLFSSMMRKENTGIDYQNEHQMHFKNAKYGSHITNINNYGLKKVGYTLPEKVNKNEYEARLIASDIQRKIREKFAIFDGEKLRPVTYKDFAIITSTKTSYFRYREVFSEFKIPLFIEKDESTKDSQLTMVLQNIIHLLNMRNEENYQQNPAYLHAFLSLYRSFLNDERDDNYLADITNRRNFEDYAINQPLEETYQIIPGLTLAQTLEVIIEKFQIFEHFPLINSMDEQCQLLNNFFKIAKQMDKMNYTLGDFATYFDDLETFEVEQTYTPSDDTTDAVKLLTIFASKGLEYSICYYPELDHGFNHQDVQSKQIITSKYGLRVSHAIGKAEDYIHRLMKNEERISTIQERMNIFYVALTRTHEVGYLFINEDKSEKNFFHLSQINSMQDFYIYSQVNLSSYEMNIEEANPPKKEVQNNGQTFELAELPALNQEFKEYVKASKDVDTQVDEETLLIGNKYHAYLEHMNFATKDTSFIKDEHDRKVLDEFLKQSLFDHVQDAKVAHEYQFYDEKNNVHGIIDLLLIYDDHIDIIDFKLSKIDDAAYDRQLHVYKDYISQISQKKINTYVMSIFTGRVREIL